MISAYLKPKTADGDWIQFLQFWLGVAMLGGMGAITFAEGSSPLVAPVIALIGLAGALLLIVTEALAAQWRAALVDLGLLSLAPLIGYALIAAFSN